MAKKQAKQDLPNYFEVNTWMVLDACNTMDEATSILALIAKSSDRLTQQALYGVITVLVNAEMTLNEYLDKPDGLE
jgi:hypothetical protein